MKVYIIVEGNENIIRCGLMNDENAENILKSFPHLNLKIKVIEVIDFASDKLLEELGK
jgi:uncharacterized protein (DUF433 family)